MTKLLLKNKFINISIIISILSIIITTAINIQIANEYLRVDGKTKALFGIKEVFQFSYQYYVSILGVAALIFAIIANVKFSSKSITILFAVSSIVLVFVRIWRIFI